MVGITAYPPCEKVPVKPTIKEVDAGLNVVKTLQRAKLWEVQTPQVGSVGLRLKGNAGGGGNSWNMLEKAKLVGATRSHC